MQNNLIDKKIVDQKLAACGISDMEDATIRDIVKVVSGGSRKRGKFTVWKWAFPDLLLLNRYRRRDRGATCGALNSTDARRPQGIQGRRFQVREELRGHRHQAGRYHPDRGFHASLFRRLHGSNGM